MEDAVDLVLIDRSEYNVQVLQFAADDIAPAETAFRHELASADPVANETGNTGSSLQELLDHPRSQQACGPGDEDLPILPEIHCHVFHGALPLDHSDSSTSFSLTVSMGCQNPV